MSGSSQGNFKQLTKLPSATADSDAQVGLGILPIAIGTIYQALLIWPLLIHGSLALIFKMTRNLFILILLTTDFVYPGESFSQTTEQTKYSNPFDTIKYDKVIAYDYNGSPQLQIVVNGQVLPIKSRIFKQKELTMKQVDVLNKTLGDTKSYGGSTAACFDPHFGIVFFYQNRIAGHISICLACNRLYSTPEISATLSHKTDSCDKCYAFGFSKRARKDISRLVKELKFSHWQLDSELFD